LAADLVGRKVAVIFAGGIDVSIRAMRAAISVTPVVFATGVDPVELGLVASFNRPGGNATAVTTITAVLWPKRMELVRDMSTPTIRPRRPSQTTCRRQHRRWGSRPRFCTPAMIATSMPPLKP